MARALALLLASPLLVACGGPSPARPSAPVAAVAPAAGEAPDALAARGEYAAAAERYRAGLRARPDDLMLHFALGSVLSYLDEPEETRAEFRWVVAHGSPGRPEVATARQWLAAAERLERPASRPRPPTATPVAATPADAPPAGFGTLRGTTAWPTLGPDAAAPTLEIRLLGVGAATAGKRMTLRLPLGRPYVMAGVPAGAWRLTAKSQEVPLWDNRVVVEAGKETVLDLMPGTSKVAAADFPKR